MRTFIVTLSLISLGASIHTGRACAEPDTDRIRAAVAQGLRIVQAAAENYPSHRDCFSCHHQTLPMLAMELSGRKGFDVDRKLLQEQAEFTWKSFEKRREIAAQGKGVGGGSMTVGYGLWALDIAKWKKDSTTTALVSYLLKTQAEDGSWKRSSNRPPLEESDITCTILAVYYMGKFASDDQQPDVDEATKRARAWILGSEPESHEDRVSRLGALALLKADRTELAKAQEEIFESQQDNGGWSQLPEMSSDAYATGLTLFTMQRTGISVNDAKFERGVRFLLDSQCDDGSWFVKSRSKPIQRFFDNGDPHGKDQFISIPATSWATAALALTLPPTEAERAERVPVPAKEPSR